MRLKNFNLSDEKRRDATRFVQKMLDIDNEIIIVFVENDNKERTSWNYNFIENNSQ